MHRIQLATTMNRRKEKWGGRERKEGKAGEGRAMVGHSKRTRTRAAAAAVVTRAQRNRSTHTPPQIYTCCRF